MNGRFGGLTLCTGWSPVNWLPMLGDARKHLMNFRRIVRTACLPFGIPNLYQVWARVRWAPSCRVRCGKMIGCLRSKERLECLRRPRTRKMPSSRKGVRFLRMLFGGRGFSARIDMYYFHDAAKCIVQFLWRQLTVRSGFLRLSVVTKAQYVCYDSYEFGVSRKPLNDINVYLGGVQTNPKRFWF